MRLLWTVVFASIVLPAQAQMAWRSTPEVAMHEGEADGHDHGHSHRPAAYYLRDGAGAALTFWKPNLEQLALPPVKADGKVPVRPSGVDNYHLLMASRPSESGEEVALRYVYMRGKPSGQSPSRLVDATKAPLEIVPAPLPREHWRYQTSAPAVFVVRYAGKPLARQPVQLETSNGSFMEAITDLEGRVEFTLPEDFAYVGRGREANAPAEFIVSTSHVVDGFRRRTTLSADYHVNPAHWQSSLGGVLALLVGFAGGVALWRRLPTEGRS